MKEYAYISHNSHYIKWLNAENDEIAISIMVTIFGETWQEAYRLVEMRPVG